MTQELIHNQATFESIKKTNELGQEYWSARELSDILEYAEYRNFLPVIERAKTACSNSEHSVKDHFVNSHEMVDIGSGAKRRIEDSIQKIGKKKPHKNLKDK